MNLNDFVEEIKGRIPLTSKQIAILKDTHRYLLVSGPRKSGKTIGVLHKIILHMVTTPFGSVAAFAKTIKSAKEAGFWYDLKDFILPQWFELGFYYTSKASNKSPGAIIDPQTKTLKFSINNIFGGESEFRLFSLNNDDEVEERLKNTRFSMIFFSELSNFQDRKIFTVSAEQLRMIHLKRNQHQWIADTNPADEGEDSWIYKIWYEDRINRANDPSFNADDYGLIEVFIHDNPFLTEEDITDLKARCSYDPTLLDRYFKGLWIKGGLSQRLFASTFSEKIHVIGGVDYETGEEEVIWPDPEHSEFIVGLDPGYMNNAIIFVEKRISTSGKPIFSVFDEYVRLNYELSIDEFTSELLNRLDRWENLLNSKIEWKFYIDPSSATTTRLSLNSVAIADASNGRVNFIPAPREGIESSVNFIKSLLKSNRLYISANCRNVIEMFKEIRASNKLGESVKRENNPYKHTLDALRYAICSDSIVFGPNTRRLTTDDNSMVNKVIAF